MHAKKACRVSSSVLLGALLVHATIWVVSADTSGPLPSAIERAEKHVNELSKILVDLKKSVRPQDCSDLQRAGQINSGVYVIFPTTDSFGVAVYCDMATEGGGWTTIQKRGQFGNSVYYFYRNWTEYTQGFGDPNKEYWIGNNVLHDLTSQERKYVLRIELKNHTGETIVVVYPTFKVANEAEEYKLSLAGFTGPSGSDALSYADGASFSTFDRDHDVDARNCAQEYRGGWWYVGCHQSNLNGLNLNGAHSSYGDGIEWSALREDQQRYSYPEVTMKIREIDFLPDIYFFARSGRTSTSG
ncbi:techylectin-5A-like [Ixodes scapularis]|uniref:techylectin-5A-like n=1 Tax=Ixodes scapularis TaxID=6945 RepID=UPI001A9EB3F7|nr:techylectin-5A-like [Ixodes scapularis]